MKRYILTNAPESYDWGLYVARSTVDPETGDRKVYLHSGTTMEEAGIQVSRYHSGLYTGRIVVTG